MSNKPKTIVKRVTAALNMPRKMGDRIVKAQFILKSLTGNPNFPSPFPANVVSLAQFAADIAALVSSQTTAKGKTTGTADARNAALITVENDLRSLLQLVQAAADKNPANAENIILSAGFDVKKVNVHGKRQNDVQHGSEEGMVVLTGEGTGPHEWRMSTDNINWIALPSSRTARTTVAGLTPGIKYFFQNRQMLTKGMKSEWSQSVAIRVQ